MARYATLGLLLGVLLLGATAKKFSRCELVRELQKNGFNNLRNWVCLVESESGRDTSSVGGPNKDGSYDYGLFQINSRYWCGIKGKGGACNVRCSDLTNSDISDDSRCAKLIFKRQGFRAWYGWRNKCQSKLPDISKC